MLDCVVSDPPSAPAEAPAPAPPATLRNRVLRALDICLAERIPFPSNPRIAARVGCTRDHVRRVLSQMHDAGEIVLVNGTHGRRRIMLPDGRVTP